MCSVKSAGVFIFSKCPHYNKSEPVRCLISDSMMFDLMGKCLLWSINSECSDCLDNWHMYGPTLWNILKYSLMV